VAKPSRRSPRRTRTPTGSSRARRAPNDRGKESRPSRSAGKARSGGRRPPHAERVVGTGAAHELAADPRPRVVTKREVAPHRFTKKPGYQPRSTAANRSHLWRGKGGPAADTSTGVPSGSRRFRLSVTRRAAKEPLGVEPASCRAVAAASILRDSTGEVRKLVAISEGSARFPVPAAGVEAQVGLAALSRERAHLSRVGGDAPRRCVDARFLALRAAGPTGPQAAQLRPRPPTDSAEPVTVPP
jgi:hypothetical protein